MLEWFSSKMAVAVAAMLLLSSVTAYFTIQKDSIRRTEIENVAHGIAEFANAVFDLTGEAEFVVACDGEAGLIVPGEVGGSPYEIHLRRDSVIIVQGSMTAVGHWTGDLHFWRHQELAIMADDVESLDAENPSLDIPSCQRFKIALDDIVIDNSAHLLAFAHPLE
jgi:hypothetical protein